MHFLHKKLQKISVPTAVFLNRQISIKKGIKKGILLTLLLVLPVLVKAQQGAEVTGVLQDTSGNRIIAATVKLKSGTDSLVTRSNADGTFLFRNVNFPEFSISVTSLGYKPFSEVYTFGNQPAKVDLGILVLQLQPNVLSQVNVSGTPTVTIKEDTIEYRASDYKLRENALAEDLLKKLPGVEVDKDGNVKAQGENVSKVRVNGKDFFSGDVQTATRQLPADIIDKIQVIDDYGDMANITGIKTGESSKVLNIQTRADKNKGYFGRGETGAGDQDRYRASLSGNYFNDAQQLSFLGNLNNTNTLLFNFGGGSGGEGARAGRGGGGNRVSIRPRGPKQSSASDGITSIGSLGFNYRDDWGTKISTYGSYSFDSRNNDLISTSIQENSFQNSVILNNQDIINNTITDNHRFNWNLEYKPDTLNYIKFSPTFNYSKTDGDNYTGTLIQNNNTNNLFQENTTKTASEIPDISTDLLFNHRFPKKGRNISLNLSISNAKTDQQEDAATETRNYASADTSGIFQHQQLDENNRNFSTGAELSYIEPVTKNGGLEISYRFNYSQYNNQKTTDEIGPGGLLNRLDSLSNNYNYSFTTNRIGLMYREEGKRYNYQVGAAIQPSVLEDKALVDHAFTTYRNTGLNFAPVARFNYTFSNTREFSLFYNGKSTEPVYSQLQPTTDYSNPQFPVTGNPNLGAEFNHTVGLRYRNFNFSSGDVLFANLSATFAEDKIVTNLIAENTDDGLVQETTYLNADGYYTLKGFYVWSKPFDERKYVLSLSGSANYNNNISFADGEKNTGKNWVFTNGVNLQINPNDWLELNPGASYSYNRNRNDILTSTDTEVSGWGLNFNSRIYVFGSWIIGTDLSKTFNSGYSGSLEVTDPLILNTYLEKEFLKGRNASLRLQGYDLFNQNTNISHDVSGNMITDSRSNGLSRYFMLTFSLRLQKFTGHAPNRRPMIRNIGSSSGNHILLPPGGGG